MIKLCNLRCFDQIYSNGILFTLDRPTIWSAQPSVYGIQDYSVQLNFSFDGVPVPNITWTSPNGSVLISQSHFMIQSTNTSTTLTMSGLGLGDSGTYTCNASNSIGVSSASILLVVQCKLLYSSSCFSKIKINFKSKKWLSYTPQSCSPLSTPAIQPLLPFIFMTPSSVLLKGYNRVTLLVLCCFALLSFP